MNILFQNATIIQDDRYVKGKDVYIEAGIIQTIGEGLSTQGMDCVVDVKGEYLVPALLDTHTHGAMGHDFNACSGHDIDTIATYYRSEGVSAFLASLVCESHEQTLHLLDVYEHSTNKALAGVHLEGPYLNKNRKAVMKEEYLRSPNQEECKQYIERTSKFCAMTIAPELEGAMALIEYAHTQGVVMNIGHTEASVDQVLEAQDRGAQGITHLYNAMSQHEHRHPGVVSAAFVSNLYCELIVDGFHVHKDVVWATYKMIGKDRLILVSDANPCKGLSEGEYSFSGHAIVVKNQEATVKETGRIAGSTLTMQKAVQNMMEYCGIGIKEAVQMASTNPAQLYGWNKGCIEVGFDGDVLVVDDAFEILHMCSEDTVWY